MPMKVPKSSKKKTETPAVMRGMVVAIRPRKGIIVLRADDGTERVIEGMKPSKCADVRVGQVIEGMAPSECADVVTYRAIGWLVVASLRVLAGVERRATELGRPHDERVVQHPA